MSEREREREREREQGAGRDSLEMWCHWSCTVTPSSHWYWLRGRPTVPVSSARPSVLPLQSNFFVSFSRYSPPYWNPLPLPLPPGLNSSCGPGPDRGDRGSSQEDILYPRLWSDRCIPKVQRESQQIYNYNIIAYKCIAVLDASKKKKPRYSL